MGIKFGQNIKALRKLREITQEELADKLELSRTTITGYEKGDSYPDFRKLLELAKLLNVGLDDLVYGDLENGIGYNVAAEPEEKIKRIQTISEIMKEMKQLRGRIEQMEKKKK